ncbi:hypothetical protein WJT74_06920 [Sphingomicrobium sp. XHP0239]|uniref:hypothetical protein n=1 Tax=Sphingomicrobium maritimum TaxID=3133972 RepID=UPI0031CCC898
MAEPETPPPPEPPEPPAHRRAPRMLRGWFGKLRRRRWLKLFAFEFTVVLLGVLAATGLNHIFSERAAEARAEDALDSLRVELAMLDLGVERRLRTYPCTIWRLEQIEKRIKDEPAAIEHQMYHPPMQALVTFPGWGSETIAEYRRYLNEEQIESITKIGEFADQLEKNQAIEDEAWNDIHRISEDLGEATDADLSEAKGGLVTAKLIIVDIWGIAGFLREELETLDVKGDYSSLDQMRQLPFVCDKMLGYSVEDQMEELSESGRLVTGQLIESWYPNTREGRAEQEAAAAR